jgi:hypothetical protein
MLECSVEKQSAKKTKQGQRPALDFSSFTPVPSPIVSFLEWLRLVAPPVFPPSDLDHTRPTDTNVTYRHVAGRLNCEWITRT